MTMGLAAGLKETPKGIQSPTPFALGEGLVIRILSQSNILLGLENMGLSEYHLQAIERLIHQPSGVIILGGLAGSGKTTVAYSMLSRVNNPGVKILTIENPVEYLIDGINQAVVNEKSGFTFPAAIRSFLRQDPDILFVGEMRDEETANIIIQAGLTGHLCITTIHADIVAAMLERLAIMNIQSFGSLIGMAAQCLVRKSCPDCREPYKFDQDDPLIKFLGITRADLSNHNLFRAVGCEKCQGTGYRGRILLFELMELDPELNRMISAGESPEKIMEAARAKGFRTMLDDARQKVLDGIIEPEEAFRMLGAREGIQGASV
jgi:type II secretory ATPase GspE/PulE/Tfp pilus assembly ATPase PilB-like protein